MITTRRLRRKTDLGIYVHDGCTVLVYFPMVRFLSKNDRNPDIHLADFMFYPTYKRCQRLIPTNSY